MRTLILTSALALAFWPSVGKADVLTVNKLHVERCQFATSCSEVTSFSLIQPMGYSLKVVFTILWYWDDPATWKYLKYRVDAIDTDKTNVKDSDPLKNLWSAVHQPAIIMGQPKVASDVVQWNEGINLNGISRITFRVWDLRDPQAPKLLGTRTYCIYPQCPYCAPCRDLSL